MFLAKLITMFILGFVITVSAVPTPAKDPEQTRQQRDEYTQKLADLQYERCMWERLFLNYITPRIYYQALIDKRSGECKRVVGMMYRMSPTDAKVEEVMGHIEQLRIQDLARKSPQQEGGKSERPEDNQSNAFDLGQRVKDFGTNVARVLNGAKLNGPILGGPRPMPAMRFVPL